jgi:dipeptidyl aminopeptidase/acylaminoacyl peptidase
MTANTAVEEATWQQRFRVATVFWSALAEECPARGLAASNRSGRTQLHAWDVASGDLRQLTDRPEGQLFGFIAPDGGHVYYLDDEGGNEIGHLVRIPFAGGPPQDVTPNLPPYTSFGGAIAASGNLLAFMAAADGAFSLVAVALAPDGSIGEPRVLYRSERLFWPPLVSPDGKLAVVASTERTGLQHFTTLAFDTTTGERVAELWDGPETSVAPVAFARRAAGIEPRLAGTTDRSGYKRPLIWHPLSGQRDDLDVDHLPGDVTPLDWSPDGDRLLLMQTSHARHRLAVYDLRTGTATALDHPAGNYGGAFFGPAGEIFANWTDSTHPLQVIALDPATGARLRTVLPAGDAPASRPLRSITYPSSDGQEIQGWLGTPAGAGPFPTILYVHGGPEDVEIDRFDPEAQVWLDHGYAYLSINFRGSTTFGRAFQQQIWGDIGHWELEDMVAARDWLIREGVARPEAIFPSGWSYGGFLTLLALGKRPDLWAGGLAGIAVADWTLLYEDASEALRGYCTAIFGGTPTDKSDAYAVSSPITYVDRVTAPVLIIQGRNDTRTPARQVEVYADRLRSLGKRVELSWFESGHLGAFTDVEQAIANHELMLRFARQVIG